MKTNSKGRANLKTEKTESTSVEKMRRRIRHLKTIQRRIRAAKDGVLCWYDRVFTSKKMCKF